MDPDDILYRRFAMRNDRILRAINEGMPIPKGPSLLEQMEDADSWRRSTKGGQY